MIDAVESWYDIFKTGDYYVSGIDEIHPATVDGLYYIYDAGFVWSYNDVVYVFVFYDNTLRKSFPPYSLVNIELLGELVDSDEAIVAMVVDRIRIYEL